MYSLVFKGETVEPVFDPPFEYRRAMSALLLFSGHLTTRHYDADPVTFSSEVAAIILRFTRVHPLRHRGVHFISDAAM